LVWSLPEEGRICTFPPFPFDQGWGVLLQSFQYIAWEGIKVWGKSSSESSILQRIFIDRAFCVSVLQLLGDPKKHQLTLMQKLKLYDGKTLPGYTQDNVKESRQVICIYGLWASLTALSVALRR
jgi:hypothetical protein